MNIYKITDMDAWDVEAEETVFELYEKHARLLQQAETLRLEINALELVQRLHSNSKPPTGETHNV